MVTMPSPNMCTVPTPLPVHVGQLPPLASRRCVPVSVANAIAAPRQNSAVARHVGDSFPRLQLKRQLRTRHTQMQCEQIHKQTTKLQSA